MSSTTNYLAEFGLSVRKQGDRVIVSPRALVTKELRQHIQTHRRELLAELAANDGVERRCHWQVKRGARVICTMVGEPVTRNEALLEVRWRWPDAEVL